MINTIVKEKDLLILLILPQYEVRVATIYFEDEDWDNAAEHYGSCFCVYLSQSVCQ